MSAKIPDDLPETDKRELRLFRAYLESRAAAKRGEALDGPELLYECVYGHETDETEAAS